MGNISSSLSSTSLDSGAILVKGLLLGLLAFDLFITAGGTLCLPSLPTIQPVQHSEAKMCPGQPSCFDNKTGCLFFPISHALRIWSDSRQGIASWTTDIPFLQNSRRHFVLTGFSTP